MIRSAWFLGLLLWCGPAAPQGVDAEASCSLSFGAGRQTTFRYRALAFDAEAVARARGDRDERARLNQLLAHRAALALSLPMTLQVGDGVLKAGEYRLALAVAGTGALELSYEEGGERRVLPLELTEGEDVATHLQAVLTPAEDGLLALVLRFGPETGRLLFRPSRGG